MGDRSPLVILDANIVIELHRLGIWGRVVELCDIYLARTVLVEADYYVVEGVQHAIDLGSSIRNDDLRVFDVDLKDLRAFRGRFDTDYSERLDPGELESLVFLLESDECPSGCRVCSADKIVYRVLGNLRCSERAISLQEILNSVGMSRELHHAFCRQYREKWLRRGFEDSMYGRGAD
jgi:hypothetical protein